MAFIENVLEQNRPARLTLSNMFHPVERRLPTVFPPHMGDDTKPPSDSIKQQV